MFINAEKAREVSEMYKGNTTHFSEDYDKIEQQSIVD